MHAAEVTLLLYSKSDLVHPLHEYRFNPLINKSGRVRHCRLKAAAIPEAHYYGYRVAGPTEPAVGNRFDDQKILVDPYARSLFFPEHFSCRAAKLPGKRPRRHRAVNMGGTVTKGGCPTRGVSPGRAWKIAGISF